MLLIGKQKLQQRNENIVTGFFGTARTLENPLVNEIPIQNNIFLIRLNNQCMIEFIER